MAEGSDDLDLNKTFINATKYVKSIVSKLSESNLLEFYSYYKQATEGQCNKPKPSWYQMAEKQKWQVWSNLKDMDQDTAKQKYIYLLTKIDEAWMTNEIEPELKQQWVCHSSMLNQDEVINDEDKTIFDWVKENNMEMLKKLNTDNKIDPNVMDGDGLALLHWAADRGHIDVAKFLIMDVKVNVNSCDTVGQTPLHYAASCGHADVINLLLKHGADKNVKDEDGLVASDLAESTSVKELLVIV